MAGELARCLVEAAAEAMRAGGFVDPDDDCVPTFYPADADRDALGSIDVWAPVEDPARAAVAAVLETLARSGQVAWAESLQALADEVKTGEDR